MNPTLKQFYSGFTLSNPSGNNSFSYNLRNNKTIFVPPIMEGSLDDLVVGDQPVFSEICDGQEVNKKGLKNFVYMSWNNKEIFIFDNHNHAFFFWLFGLKEGSFKPGQTLIHVDQHTDMREPAQYLEQEVVNRGDLEKIFQYTNEDLNVGNFIKPALTLNVFAQVEHINSREAFEKELPEEYVLDIDVDVFSKEMNYIDHDLKVKKIRQYIDQTSFITIATSPYFMEQDLAINVVKELLQD